MIRGLLSTTALLFHFSALTIAVSLTIAGSAAAQQRTSIEIPSVLTLNPNVETAFPVRITAGANMPRRAMLLIHGIPENLTLTEGRVFDSGIWFIPAASIPSLKIATASEANGQRIPLKLSLVAPDGTMLAEGRTTLIVGPPGFLEAGATASLGALANAKSTLTETKSSAQDDVAARTQQVYRPTPGKNDAAGAATGAASGAAAGVAALSVPPAEEAERLKMGQAALALHDIAGARLVFQYLTNRGSAAGAWHLAQTYDPQILANTTVSGQFKPDEAVAAKWYAKAAEWGHAEARKKIAGGR